MKQKTKRRSYKNAIAVALASFSAVALISTGLAAFVIIRDDSDNASGGITVGKVEANNIEVKILTGETGKIHLDAAAADKTGRIQSQDGSLGEVLTHTITGEVNVGAGKTIADNLDLSYILNIKSGETVMNADFLTRYITTNRLEFVHGTKFNESVAIVPTITGSEETSGSATFSFTFGFAWGDAYDYLNPSIFYDEMDGGIYIHDNISEIVDELEALQYHATQDWTFELVVHAKNK